MKTNSKFLFFLLLIMGFVLISCGGDDTESELDSMIDNPMSPNNKGGGRIDTEIYIINDDEILMGGSYVDEFDRGNSWWSYLYTLQFGFGVYADAYVKGMTEVKATLWVGNGSINSESKKSIGKEKVFTLPITSAKETNFYDWFWVYSKDSKIVLNYKLEYYNSNDGKYYTLPKTYTVTLYAKN